MGRYNHRISPQFSQILNPMGGSGVTMAPSAWQANISQSSIGRCHFEREVYCLRLSYFGDLQTRNNCS
jgi:hypothetical protein